MAFKCIFAFLLISLGWLHSAESAKDKDCFQSSCYLFVDEGNSWTKNRKECQSNGGDLVSMETEDEWSFIKDKIQTLSDTNGKHWHIGLKKDGDDWAWINGEALTYDKWERSQPSGDGDYGTIAKLWPEGTSPGGFNDQRDSLPRGYICEMPEAPASIQACMKDTCFGFHDKGASWKENRKRCEKSGGDLVSMETEDKWEFVKNKIQTLTERNGKHWHIGLIMEGDDWMWVSGKPLSIDHWERSQPSGDGIYGTMAKLWPEGTTPGGFNDQRNDLPRGFICEYPKAIAKKKSLLHKMKIADQ